MSEWVSQSVTRSPIELFWTAKKANIFCKGQMGKSWDWDKRIYIQGRHTLQFNLQMADIPDRCMFLEVASFGHLVRWSFMQINKTRLLSICNAAESLHWLACKWCSVVSGSMYYTHFIALQYKALWGGCGGFLFCWNSKFGNMHDPKMSQFVHIFQNCFCFSL